MKKSITLIFAALSIFGCVRPGVAVQPRQAQGSFEACVQAGYELIRTYPMRCITPDGQVYVKEQPVKKTQDSICKDLCGDGACQQIVCMGEGCPCAENPVNCAQDCVASE